MSPQEQNFVSDLSAWAEAMLALRADGRALSARWYVNDFAAALESAPISVVFPHLDAAKIAAAVTALVTTLDALGDDASGQAVNLIKLRG
jgi:hypothetical protein